MGVSKYSNLKFLKNSIDSYFNLCDEKNIEKSIPPQKKSAVQKFYTISGLCCFLAISKSQFADLSSNPKTKNVIDAAKLKIENFIEENLLAGNIPPQAAIIFLKYHFNWNDKPKDDDPDILIDLGDDTEFSD